MLARKKTYLILCLVVSFSMSAATVRAQQHEALKPLLVDLQGWEADQAETMSVDTAGMKMITATRTYSKRESEVTAVVMVGNPAVTQGKIGDTKVESADGKYTVSEIDGFQVQMAFNKNDKSGGIVIVLNQGEKSGATFTLTFDGIDDKEALELAKKFDWKKMKESTAKL